MSEVFEKPRWIRDLLRYLPLKSQFVLSGNIRDQYPTEVSGQTTTLPLVLYLGNELRAVGYPDVLSFDPINGFRGVEEGTGRLLNDHTLLKRLGLNAEAGSDQTGMDVFCSGLQKIVEHSTPVTLIADFASRIINRPDSLTQAEHRCFTRALVLSHEAKTKRFGQPAKPFFNSVVWIVDKEGDLPDWLVVSNPRIRHIPIPKPDHRIRKEICKSLLRSLDGYSEEQPETIEKALKSFVEATEGMLSLDLNSICLLSKSEGIPIQRIADAVRHYKLGVTEDPWTKIDREKIANGLDFVRRRVKGQNHAVVHMLDIVKRAVTGVSASKRGSRPRGVAFLAGPTGVGKTELAKTITDLLFGDDTAYVRFDMSEFSAEHSDQRLIGAPPGYIGYDVGGELTNAIREKPFSVVLFDEIEKAHPRILDKFLQILDDGVLTSGRGDRVYFSEAFIVFTSNLGIYKTDVNGQRVLHVNAEDEHESISVKVREQIDQHFKLTLGRPEILNRIGENIIVFDFIRPGVATEIFDQMIDSTIEDLKVTQNISMGISAEARNELKTLVISDLTNGGRGIRNKLEAYFVNPLSRAIFDQGISSGDEFIVESVSKETTTNIKLVKFVAGKAQ